MNLFEVNFDETLYQLDELEKSFNEELVRCEEIAKGHLIGWRRDGKQTYLQAINDRGSYQRRGITRNKDLIRVLCRKEYLRQGLKRIADNKRCLLQAKESYAAISHDEIIAGLPPVYQTVPKDFFRFTAAGCVLPDESNERLLLAKEIAEWEKAPYEISSYKSELRTNTTSRGEKMRSKSEVNIAEKFYQHNVPFRYEEVLRIGPYEFAPDFKIRRRRDGKFFYHEHCGMPHDPDYISRHNWKLEQYASVGIVPWDNLIVTYNDIHGNLDMRIIESEIINKLL